MSWHSIKQAQELTGKSRSTLYRDMNAGRLSYRSEVDGRRHIETAELIRVYGEIRQSETLERNNAGQADATLKVMSEMVSELRQLREEVAGLKAELQEVRRLEHKKPEQPEQPEQLEQPTVSGPEQPRPWWRRMWD